MALTPIRVDGLPTTNNPSTSHVLPAMKDGLTVGLLVQQIIDLARAEIVGSAPEALDTINELAAALNDDANAVNAILSAISNVDNTADLAKPVSVPQQTALDGKQTTDDLVFLTGTVADQNTYTLPLPAGFLATDCVFLWASSGTADSSYSTAYGYTGSGRNAHCHSSAGYYRSISWIVIGRK